jgi:hypothetical protein
MPRITNEPAYRFAKRRQITLPVFSFLLFFSLKYILSNLSIIFKCMVNFVGIDISKNDFYACFKETGDSIIFPNNSTGFNAFRRQLNNIGFNEKETIIGVESTGIYHLRFEGASKRYQY